MKLVAPGAGRVRLNLIAALMACLSLACASCLRRAVEDTYPPPMKAQPQVPLAFTTSALDRYIPGERARFNVPGLSVALVRDGKIAWARGFGAANSITGAPITTATVFEAASLGKPVEAYAALKLVEAGKLALNKPLSSYLTRQFLPPSEFRDKVTLETVLTHTSGLSNAFTSNWADRQIAFEPGTHFAYSGVGFIYLQKVIEAITGMPLNRYMRQAVFEPLEMSSSSYIYERSFGAQLANGHRYVFGFALPMWKWKYKKAVGPSSLYSTPSDMAKFMCELMNPKHIDPSLIQDMLTPKVGLNIDISWGLGIALDHTPDGQCFWQWGDNGDFKAFMAGYEAQKLGVVVMTNSSRGLRLAREVTAHAIDGM